MKPKNDPHAHKVLVTGAGGFIGHHLVKYLKSKGLWVRGVDIKKPEYEPSPADEFLVQDLRVPENCQRSVLGADEVYQLAADMGGIGYITRNFASLSRNNTLINANMLEASHLEGVERYLFTSSACVYPSFLQHVESVKGLREEDAIPADPEKGYGWEKLFAEQLTMYYGEDHGLGVHVVRLHNVYGPLGAYQGGREKAPAAICRKVAEADEGAIINVWGDGEQTRSFCYVGDCVEGLSRIMETDDRKPFNLGTEDLVTINGLVDLVSGIAGKHLQKQHDVSQPQGVRGRNSDNSRLRKVLNWEPRTRLEDGLRRTYPWIWSRLDETGKARPPRPKESVVGPPIPR
jgi:nucleoside-diphosphate-sugar epimerase